VQFKFAVKLNALPHKLGLQPVKLEPTLANALKVMLVPLGYVPAGVPDTIPVPVPAEITPSL
jgi:hypothetical protein